MHLTVLNLLYLKHIESSLEVYVGEPDLIYLCLYLCMYFFVYLFINLSVHLFTHCFIY